MKCPAPAVAVIALASALACSSINIKTGPPTDQEIIRESEDRGSRMRAEWSNQLQQASPIQQANIMRGFVDSTTARFIRFGYQVIEVWRTESERRGVQLSAEEVRQVIEHSNQFDLPLLEAYEDVLEFGVSLVIDSRFFDAQVKNRLVAYRDFYYEVYNAVFFPNGTTEDYERLLHDMESRTQQVSQLLAEELVRYE